MAVFEVWDPEGKVSPITFPSEKKALEYRERMEKTCKRDFRLKKHFGNIKPVVKDEFEIYLDVDGGFAPGEIITLTKGLLVPRGNVIYCIKQLRVREDGTLIAAKKEVVTSGV